jgi:hypothetical protein
MAESSVEQYCIISEAMKLKSVPFDSDRRKLKFIDTETTAFELVSPELHSLLLVFVITRMKQTICYRIFFREAGN